MQKWLTWRFPCGLTHKHGKQLLPFGSRVPVLTGWLCSQPSYLHEFKRTPIWLFFKKNPISKKKPQSNPKPMPAFPTESFTQGIDCAHGRGLQTTVFALLHLMFSRLTQFPRWKPGLQRQQMEHSVWGNSEHESAVSCSQAAGSVQLLSQVCFFYVIIITQSLFSSLSCNILLQLIFQICPAERTVT